VELLIRLLLKTGRRVTVIAPEQPDLVRPEGCETFLMKATLADFPKPLWFKALKEAFTASLEAGRPDHIFSEGYYALGLEKEAAGIPVTAFIHNFHLVHFSKLFSEVDSPRSFAYFFLRSVPRLVLNILRYELPFLRRCDRIASVSGRNAGLLMDYYRLPSNKVDIVQNWVETDRLTPSPETRAAARRKLGIREDALVFLGIGALWRPKGFQVAIEGFRRVAADFPSAVLLLAGGGNYREKLEKLSGNLLTQGRIRFLGKVSRGAVPELYAAADVFSIPSIHPEGLAYTLIEAMASGLPSIATSLGGNIETLGQTGILVHAGNSKEMAAAMLTLASDPALRRRLGAAARERALELFSEDAALKKIERLLDLGRR
jgi:glycosyltransferase involved in cell wall biosynthesis